MQLGMSILMSLWDPWVCVKGAKRGGFPHQVHIRDYLAITLVVLLGIIAKGFSNIIDCEEIDCCNS